MSTGNQRPWWVAEQPPTPPPPPLLRGVAYYRHSAKDRQENSVAIQQELVQKWARENGVEIVHEFADRGNRVDVEQRSTHWPTARERPSGR